MMSYTPKILAFAGSLREQSLNKKLLRIAVEAAQKAGSEVTVVDLRDYPMPLYNADIQTREGFPPMVLEFKKLLASHQGLLIASPEYNGSVSGALKNTIDWVSRPVEQGEAAMALFRGKVGAIMSASPGLFGGVRGLMQLRYLLDYLGVLMLTEQVAIPTAHEAFTENDMSGNVHLRDEKLQTAVERLSTNLAHMLTKVHV